MSVMTKARSYPRLKVWFVVVHRGQCGRSWVVLLVYCDWGSTRQKGWRWWRSSCSLHHTISDDLLDSINCPWVRREINHWSTSMTYKDSTSQLTEDESVQLTVNEFPSLSLDVQIQRSIPVWDEQKSSVNIKILLPHHRDFIMSYWGKVRG